MRWKCRYNGFLLPGSESRLWIIRNLSKIEQLCNSTHVTSQVRFARFRRHHNLCGRISPQEVELFSTALIQKLWSDSLTANQGRRWASNVALNEQENSFDLLWTSSNAVVSSSSISPSTRESISPSSREQNGDIFEVLKRLACKHDTLVRALHPQPFLDWLDWLLWHVDHIVPSAFGISREWLTAGQGAGSVSASRPKMLGTDTRYIPIRTSPACLVGGYFESIVHEFMRCSILLRLPVHR